MKELNFFICKQCGDMVEKINDVGCDPSCCGEPMKPLKANTSDGATEKHVPVITVDGSAVSVAVGSAPHPMEADHYIEWIVILTDKGVQRKHLKPGDKPEAVFALSAGETLLAAYEYCNKHGLWKAEA
ncbi:MAG: desulfoferrodoxin Dfx [Treponemataceae bacterium]|nr:desulfoferrodoxin Dfx [Treponemataceae bacterium]